MAKSEGKKMGRNATAAAAKTLAKGSTAKTKSAAGSALTQVRKDSKGSAAFEARSGRFEVKGTKKAAASTLSQVSKGSAASSYAYGKPSSGRRIVDSRPPVRTHTEPTSFKSPVLVGEAGAMSVPVLVAQKLGELQRSQEVLRFGEVRTLKSVEASFHEVDVYIPESAWLNDGDIEITEKLLSLQTANDLITPRVYPLQSEHAS